LSLVNLTIPDCTIKDFTEVGNLLSKKQLAVENAKEIEAITNSLIKELDVLKKKVEALKETLKEEEHIVR
jgi:hypothetical protein